MEAMNSSQQVKNYWEERAKGDKEATSTTNDVYLRLIEQRVLSERCRQMPNFSILDVGCGDARTTAVVADRLPGSQFTGIDYADHMIENAKRLHYRLSNLELFVADCSSGTPRPSLANRFDIAYSTRCLINILEDHHRLNAFKFIHRSLKPGATYLMIENFMEGQNAFNNAREEAGLSPISVRPHNRFFDDEELKHATNGLFRVEESLNISSTYYLATRIVYSRICQANGVAPDYHDNHHKFSAQLPFAGDFGPLYLKTLKKV
jgi:SAM-dependent methyltransferase